MDLNISLVQVSILVWLCYILHISTCSSLKQSVDLDVLSDIDDDESLYSEQLNTGLLTRHKRSSDLIFHGETPSSKTRYVEVYAATDIGLYEKFDRDEDKLTTHVRNVIRNVNAIYLLLHLHIVLVGIDIWKNEDEFALSSDPDQILKGLSSYRHKVLEDVNHDATLIFTSIDLDGDTVGKALVGTMCQTNSSVSVIQFTGDAATIVAHELGHLLGMKHDEDEDACDCPSNNCIMAEQSKNSKDHLETWSSCSVDALEEHIKTDLYQCLDDIPKNPIEPPLCGDGLVQGSEECDCGPPSFCDNLCCNPLTCMLAENATCANGLCCNTETCEFKGENEVCREARTECDFPEFCSGKTVICPVDVYKWNGKECNDEIEGHCWDGECRSRERSCNNKFGKDSKVASNVCYQYMGITEQCTKNYKNGQPACSKTCGKLICETDDPNIHVERGYASKKIQEITCYNIIRDGKSDLVDNGSPCGDGNICIDEQCVPVPQLSTVCQSGCDNHGECNSEGHCHCYPGYAPPDCRSPGFGGSIDSNGGGQHPDNFKTVMLVIFLVVIPLIILFWCLVMNSNLWWKKKGLFWTRSWSPCCSKCLDSCCCPIMGMVAEKVTIPLPKPGSKIVTQQISKDNKQKTLLISHANTRTVQNNEQNLRSSVFLTDSPIPNVRFIPINNQDKSANVDNTTNMISSSSEPKLNRLRDDSETKRKHFTFAFDSPIPNIRFLPIRNGSSHSSTNSNGEINSSTNTVSKSDTESVQNGSISRKNLSKVLPSINSKPATSIRPVRPAPVAPGGGRTAAASSNENLSKAINSPPRSNDATVQELTKRFENKK